MGERTKATSLLPKPNPRLRRVKPEPESTTLEEGKGRREGGKKKSIVDKVYDQIVTYIGKQFKEGLANAKKIKGVDAFGDGGYKWVYEDKIREKKS